MLLPVGGPSIAFGLAFGIFHRLWSACRCVPTSTGTVMSSVLDIILSVQFILQAPVLGIADIQEVSLQAVLP